MRHTHSDIVSLHEAIANSHIEIKGFYRFNFNEITSSLRSGVEAPVLLLESHSSELESMTKMVSNFNSRNISFVLLDFGGKQGDFDRQNEVLDSLENIALDIISYLVNENKNRNSWMFGMFDINSVKIEKVGPIFDNMFGWNILYVLKSHESMEINPVKWTK
jgi:hypothetical protein